MSEHEVCSLCRGKGGWWYAKGRDGISGQTWANCPTCRPVKPTSGPTPGPWSCYDAFDVDDETVCVERLGTADVTVIEPHGDDLYIRRADACLIATAPDLYKVAEMLASLKAEDGGRSYPTKEMCAAAKLALARASGQAELFAEVEG